MKWLIGLVTTGFVVMVTFVVLAVSSTQSSTELGLFSHAQLEADRVMTEQMAVQTAMGADGLLERSAGPGYVKALEAHIQQFNRTIGATP